MSSSTATGSTAPRSPWPYQRQRTPSRATTSTSTIARTATTSPVTAEAAGNITSIEERVKSRQTLSRHLSQSEQHRTRRASSAAAAPVVDEPATITPSTSACSSLNSSPLTSPTTARRKSGIPVSTSTGGAGVKRSPSWMSTGGRKSSLSVPQLSTIEGSVADLSATPIIASPTEETPDEQLGDRPLIEQTEPVLHSEGDKIDDKTMKRQRNNQDTGRNDGEAFKKHNVATESKANNTEDAAPPIQGGTEPPHQPEGPSTSAGELLPLQQVKATPSTSANSSSGWRGYLTLPRSSKPPQVAASSLFSIQPDELLTALASKDVPVEHAQPQTSSPVLPTQEDIAVPTVVGDVLPSTTDVPAAQANTAVEAQTMAPSSSRRSYFDIRRWPASNEGKAQTVKAGSKKRDDPAEIIVPEAIAGESEPTLAEPENKETRDEQESTIAGGLQGSSHIPAAELDNEQPRQDKDAINAEATLRPSNYIAVPAPRPVSWWPWTAVPAGQEPTSTTIESDAPVVSPIVVSVETPQAVEQQIAVVVSLPLEPEGPTLSSGETTSGQEKLATSEPPSSEIDGNVPPIVENAAGWGSWLGSYLSQPRPVAVTTITYGPGVAPSNASTSTLSIASTIAPEADETLPLPPVLAEEETATVLAMQPVNPLLVTLPASSWSSFFSGGSRIYAPKLVDVRTPQERLAPENMEIDFSEMEAGSSSDGRPGLASPTQSQMTLKPASKTGKGIVEKTISKASSISSMASIAMLKSASTGTISAVANAGRRPSSSSMQSSTSAQPTLTSPTASTSPSGQGTANDEKSIKPLTTDKKAAKGSTTSKTRASDTPKRPPRPNLVLPSFEDTFHSPPRSLPPPVRAPSPSAHASTSATSGGLKQAVAASFGYFFSAPSPSPSPAPIPEKKVEERKPSFKGKEREMLSEKVERLPRAYSVLEEKVDLSKAGKVVVIGIHGWFMQSYLKNVVGEPTGTSTKFATMMKAAVKAYYSEAGESLNDEAITTIPLEGDGVVQDRLARLYQNLMAREDWVTSLNSADKIFIASHSQGTIVSAMLVSKLINEGEINGTKVAMLNMCSVSQGPFVSLYNSWTVPAYLYFESGAASELFEFQKPESAPSKEYLECMQHILNAGVKILFIASLNDQVVPLYSALFSSLSHPNLLRAIFVDAQAFETSADFMTNLVVFATRLRNAGLTPHGLDFHLSEALAGSLMGVGHSAIYDEPQVYKYAARYLLETSGPLLPPPVVDEESTPLIELEPFNPRVPSNSYFLPWALRGIIEDRQIRTLFSAELQQLRDEFERWDPKTKALQQVKTALEPLRFLPRSTLASSLSSVPEAAETGKDPDKKPVAKL